MRGVREISEPCGLDIKKNQAVSERVARARAGSGWAKGSFRVGEDPGITQFPDAAAFFGTDQQQRPRNVH